MACGTARVISLHAIGNGLRLGLFGRKVPQQRDGDSGWRQEMVGSPDLLWAGGQATKPNQKDRNQAAVHGASQWIVAHTLTSS
jgi:hypothetical protein